MVQTIGNPLSWGARALGDAGRTAGDVATHLGSSEDLKPNVRSLGLYDVRAALSLGWQDMMRFRSDVLALVFIYPMIGLALAFLAFEQALLPMLFPLAAGFALLGPVASIGMYEISRQQEDSGTASWGSALAALRGRVVGPVMVLGLFLLGWFMLWMAAAFAIYSMTLGPAMPESTVGFVSDVFTTSAGWMMIFLGMAVGAIFATVVLIVSAIGFPMLIDKPVGLPVAVVTSAKVFDQNRATMLMWGICVAVLLAIATIPVFLGLILVLPWLGHATWHLYRMAVSYD
ncbi:DUF2189 domain-containing protein [Cognatishimia sp. 1_MG-2023]|uniref:DUF2189 domain-containing protein n=1 Tax=Cognatishimia sp. 1_MG-2023 TaxID=3062642 RepID=UPI0026E219F4|nr:DUF2189 domain-containing protein [Cognatishimia sp. 1_MG-2023]MDO6726889.1 DUF2189 domain-containing protein [Cognatishimia sp. 1_MG-2023]